MPLLSRELPPTSPGSRLRFGADYNPEQWSEEIWHEDVALMREARVNLVAINIFGWAQIEPREGEYDFDRLDRVMELLHVNGIDVDLGTGTSSPPPWLSRAYPQSLPVTADGSRLWPGGRQAWSPASAIFREKALGLVGVLASRYRDHPALVMWHVSNELGCHNAFDYSDESAAAFRRWLRHRYADIDSLNAAWGTAFWSQRYGDWEEILPPRQAPTFANPTQNLDFRRYTSDALLDYFKAERDLLHQLTPGIPVTTNFMITNHVKAMDYHVWGSEQDLVSNDHYLDTSLDEPWRELAFCADLTRGTAAGAPWMLMEHSTSAVNWQPRNVAKLPGELLRNSLQHVARGADAVSFFQWRASRAGAEKFHSAMLPHAGTDTKVWRETRDLGNALVALDEVVDSTVEAEVAILFDWQAWWACELDSHPSVDVTYLDRAHAFHAALSDLGVTADVVHPHSDLARYKLVVVPTLYMADDRACAALGAFVRSGGHAVVTYFSGIVDEHDHIRLGGYPGAWRELLGLRVEEFFPLRSGHEARLSGEGFGTFTAGVWTEAIQLTGAHVVASWVDGPVAGGPAVTRHASGAGSAWYVGARLTSEATKSLLTRVLDDAEVAQAPGAVPGVELVRRRKGSTTYTFVINHTHESVEVPLHGVHMLTGEHSMGSIRVESGAVAVVRQH